MVADSMYYVGGLGLPSPSPKIIRVPAGLHMGSLFGMAGLNKQIRLMREWALAGMDFANPPKIKYEEGDHETNNVRWIWLRLDGKVFYGEWDLSYSEVAPPEYCGTETAGNIWLGQVWAGVDPVVAMRTTIEHCIHVGGEVQVEHLDTSANITGLDGTGWSIDTRAPVLHWTTLEHPEDGPHR